jgi:hypothetical protein
VLQQQQQGQALCQWSAYTNDCVHETEPIRVHHLLQQCQLWTPSGAA